MEEGVGEEREVRVLEVADPGKQVCYTCLSADAVASWGG